MPFQTRHPMYRHQQETFDQTKDLPFWGLFWEMGLGKSKHLIDVWGHWFAEGRIDRAVYFAKNGEYANFYYDQLPQHWPEDVPLQSLLYSSYRAKTATFGRQFKELLRAPATTFKVLVANVEGLSGSTLEDFVDDFVTRQRWGLAVDESTLAKNVKSARTKKLVALAPRSRVRRIMTGTAVTESPLDLWGQHLILKRGILGHSSLSSFRGEYCDVEDVVLADGSKFSRVTGYKNEEKLREVVKTFATVKFKEECLDLPQKLYVPRYVELDPRHRADYDRLRRELTLELESGVVVDVIQKLALSSKLHQLASGQVRDESGSYHWVDTSKLDALESILEECPGKAIVWSPYRMTLEKIVSRLRQLYGHDSVVRYFGGIPDDERVSGVKNFRDPAHPARWFVANQQSAAFGLTLTAAKTAVYFANSYRLELRLQSEDRIHRIGQDSDVTYYDIVAKDTVDETVVRALRSKKKLSDVVMSRPQAEWL